MKHLLQVVASFLFVLTLGVSPAFCEEDYGVQPGDVLRVSVLGEEDLTLEIRVSAGGRITYPLLGEVEILHYSARQIEEVLTQRLDEFLVDPQVSVFITQFAKVFVLGEVAKPGALEFKKNITVLEAITLAGGLKPHANQRRVKVIRKSDARETEIMVDLTEITQKGRQEQNIRLAPGDFVFVPESFL